MLGRKDIDDIERGGDLNTIIGKGSIVDGTIKIKNSIRVDGSIKGKITTTNSLIVGKEGEIDGEVRVKNIIVGGKVKGKIFASVKVVLESKSFFQGEIKTSKLVIDEGATFDGICSMNYEDKILSLPDSKEKKTVTVTETVPREASVGR